MELKDRLELFKNRGWSYQPLTGNIINHLGNIVTGKHPKGYIRCGIYLGNTRINVSGHQLAWYLYYDVIVSDPYVLDHIDRNTSNNRISNLRVVTRSQNNSNNDKRGYSFHKESQSYRARIGVNKKSILLGYFKTEVEARNAYLEAKKIYHKF